MGALLFLLAVIVVIVLLIAGGINFAGSFKDKFDRSFLHFSTILGWIPVILMLLAEPQTFREYLFMISGIVILIVSFLSHCAKYGGGNALGILFFCGISTATLVVFLFALFTPKNRRSSGN